MELKKPLIMNEFLRPEYILPIELLEAPSLVLVRAVRTEWL